MEEAAKGEQKIQFVSQLADIDKSIENMKKQAYTKPAMRVVELRQRHQLLNASPNNLDGHALQMRGGEGNQINDEEQVW